MPPDGPPDSEKAQRSLSAGAYTIMLGLQHLDATAIHLVFGDQTSEDRGGVPLAHTPLDRVGPDRVSKRRISRPDGGRFQREQHGPEM
jgi:hypothetical protein